MFVNGKRIVLFGWAASVLLSANTWALEDENRKPIPASYEQRFDEKINAWFDGTIALVDAEKGIFVVHGSKRAYATAYAEMLNEIYSKSSKLEGAARHEKAVEIRNAWIDKLNAAQTKPEDKYSDLTFTLASKNLSLAVFDESRFYGHAFAPLDADKDYAAKNYVSKNDASRGDQAGKIELKELQVGEHLIVGYESTATANYAYAAIRARYPDYPNADTATPENPTGKADNSKANARDVNKGLTADQQGQGKDDVEITRQIRRAIVKDDALSTYAHNVKIITTKGTVTLKGPVRSEAEKQDIEKKALTVAGEGNVTNQIEIAP